MGSPPRYICSSSVVGVLTLMVTLVTSGIQPPTKIERQDLLRTLGTMKLLDTYIQDQIYDILSKPSIVSQPPEFRYHTETQLFQGSQIDKSSNSKTSNKQNRKRQQSLVTESQKDGSLHAFNVQHLSSNDNTLSTRKVSTGPSLITEILSLPSEIMMKTRKVIENSKGIKTFVTNQRVKGTTASPSNDNIFDSKKRQMKKPIIASVNYNSNSRKLKSSLQQGTNPCQARERMANARFGRLPAFLFIPSYNCARGISLPNGQTAVKRPNVRNFLRNIEPKNNFHAYGK